MFRYRIGTFSGQFRGDFGGEKGIGRLWSRGVGLRNLDNSWYREEGEGWGVGRGVLRRLVAMGRLDLAGVENGFAF